MMVPLDLRLPSGGRERRCGLVGGCEVDGVGGAEVIVGMGGTEEDISLQGQWLWRKDG